MSKKDVGNGTLPFTRRKWIRTLAAAGSAGVVAGCLGEDGDDGEDGDGDGGDDGGDGDGVGGDGDEADFLDEYFVIPAIGNLEQVNFNMWSTNSNTFYENRLLWDGLAHYSVSADDWYPELATDWEFDVDEETVTFELRDDLEWHDGTAYTADHAADHFRVAEVMGFPPWEFATEVHAPEEHTLEFEVDAAAPSMMEYSFIGDNWVHWLFTHPKHHGEFIERIEDASTDDELDEIRGDLGQYEIEPQTAVEEGVGFGPVEVVNVTDSRIEMEPYDNYPIGRIGDRDEEMEMNFAGFEVIDFGDSESDFHQAAIADNVHGFTGTTPTEVRDQMPDHWEILQNPQFGHQSIIFSPDSLWGEDTEESRALRQAVAHFYDPSEYVEIYDEEMLNYPEPNNVTGLNTPQAESWLDDVIDDWTNYGTGDSGWVQEDAAEEKMQEAGFERDGDSWVDADSGEPLEVDMIYPVDWTANHPSYENAAEQFRRFGIEAEARGVDNVNLINTLLPQHDFQIALFSHSHGPHPLAAFRTSIGDVSEPDGTRYNNQLSEVTVPWPPGEDDGDMETVSIDDRVNELEGATDDARVQELVEELSWIWNQWVHSIQTNTAVRGNYVATDHWLWDVDGDAGEFNAEQPWTYLTRTGQLRGRSD